VDNNLVAIIIVPTRQANGAGSERSGAVSLKNQGQTGVVMFLGPRTNGAGQLSRGDLVVLVKGDQGVVVLVVSMSLDARFCSAASSCGGSSLPLFAARRKMPLAAFGLKKYLDGTGPVSKTCDNEHPPARLGHWPNSSLIDVQRTPSHKLSVKHTPGGAALGANADTGVPPAPFGDLRRVARECAKDTGKVSSATGGQSTKDVLPQNPYGSDLVSNASELKEQSGPLASQPRTTPGHADVLAWGSSDQNINWLKVASSDISNVIELYHAGKVPGRHAAAISVNLDQPARLHP
jgi:hypothetical protein